MMRYDEIRESQKSEGTPERDFNFDPEIPKFIRGPTEYRLGQFRHIREGPKNPSESLDEISMQSERGKADAVEYEHAFESDNARLYIGKVSEEQKVILSTRKNDNIGHTNTYKQAHIDLNRASSIYRRRFATVTENIDEAFCHFISKTDATAHFMTYLERASSAAETEDIKTIFPFLGHTRAVQKLKALYLERDQIKSNLKGGSLPMIREGTAEIDNQIDLLRREIYDNQFKKAQFVKQVDHLFESGHGQSSSTDEERSEYWLWVWLKKLLNYLEDDEVSDVS